MTNRVPEAVSFAHIVLAGTPYQVGRQQGEALKTDDKRASFLTPTLPFLDGYSPREAQRALDYIEKHCPGLGEEIQGAADGFGVPVEIDADFTAQEGETSETDTYIHSLMVTNPLLEPIVGAAIQALQPPVGSRGLDAGCGIGLQALSLAEAVGPAGHVTGLDLSPAFLVYAREMVERTGLSERVSFQAGDVRELPFDDDSFDWAWSANCVGYAPLEALPLVQELARVVKPGGSVAILAWSSEQLLPGYPLLEARLSATSAGIAPFAKGKRPALHFMRALGWFRDAGLENPTAQTFASDAYAPLSDDLRCALIALLQMRWPGVESELRPEDRAAYRRLCLPESPDFIVDHPDYYAFFTYSMFCGRVPKIDGL